MKKFILSLAVVAALALMGTSCKNAEMKCWEYTYTGDGSSEIGYIWNTEDYMDAIVADAKLDGSVVTYKKASKYKTPEDCIDANN